MKTEYYTVWSEKWRLKKRKAASKKKSYKKTRSSVQQDPDEHEYESCEEQEPEDLNHWTFFKLSETYTGAILPSTKIAFHRFLTLVPSEGDAAEVRVAVSNWMNAQLEQKITTGYWTIHPFQLFQLVEIREQIMWQKTIDLLGYKCEEPIDFVERLQWEICKSFQLSGLQV